MLLIISDASVLIDVECSQLTSAMFSLPWKFYVPDVLFEEELAQRHEHLLAFGLKTKSMSGELVAEAYKLSQQHRKTTVNDLLALTLAKSEGCKLLTGDKALREMANRYRVEVHGTIWLVEQLIQHEKITVDVAEVAFQRMKISGSRLPWKQVETLLSNLRTT